ncbi:type II secretion system F family protein [Paenibacillus sp. Dod16]|uniref:type II secretion system F family protein n=1 Tax=Paenibacillus sp. Dod16 TaxID=3416392 RepID=UPI003CF27079
MKLTTILWLSIVAYVVIFGIIMLVLALNKRKTKNQLDRMNPGQWMAQKRSGTRKEHPKLVEFYQKSYVHSSRIPFFGTQVRRIRQRLAIVNPYSEFTLRKETMRITYITLLITFFLILAFALLGKSLLMILLGIIGCIVLNGMLIDVFVHRIERQLLRNFRDFLEDNRHQYQSTKMIDESIYQASQIAVHDMKLHGVRIHRVLTARNPERALHAYYEVAPNRYLKVFTGIAHMIREYGDKNTNKGSLYLGAISKFVQDINFDILRQNRLHYQLNSLTIIALVPILLSFPIQTWAETYFPSMSDFYSGRLGYIIQLTMFAVSLIAYLLVRKLAETEESKYIPKPSRKRWEKKIYEMKYVKFIVDRFVPSSHTKKYYLTTQLIKDSNSPLLIQWLTLRRLMLAISTILIAIAVAVGLHINTTHQILYAPTYDNGGLMIGKMSAEEQASSIALTDFDRRVLENLKGGDAALKERVRQEVEILLSGTTSVAEVNQSVNRIVTKFEQLDSEYFKWYELIIALALGTLAYYAPIWMMLFQRKVRRVDMQNEVEQFRMLISILSQLDRIDVRTILEWMERFSTIFKPALQRCLNDYDSGATFAIHRLKEDAPYPEFVRLVERLENSLERISIQEAFDDLEMEQEYYREQKKETMNRLIESKASLGKDIGFAPVMFMLGGYIMVPFLYTSFMQMKDLVAQLMKL